MGICLPYLFVNKSLAKRYEINNEKNNDEDEDDEEDELMPIQDDENEDNNEYNLFTKLNRTESGGLRDAYKTKSKTSYVNYKIIARYIDIVDDWLTANKLIIIVVVIVIVILLLIVVISVAILIQLLIVLYPQKI
jgi:hypothetical protein